MKILTKDIWVRAARITAGVASLVLCGYAFALTPAPRDAQSDHGYQKPGADVRVVSAVQSPAVVGEVVFYTLALSSPLPQGVIQVSLKPDADLLLDSAEQEYHFDLPQAFINIPLGVVAQSEGQHFLHIFITATEPDGRVTSRALAVAFNTPHSKPQAVVNAKPVKPGSAKTGSGAATGVVVLPAKETIR